MLNVTRIRKHELGLVFRHGELHRIVGPGSYRGLTFGSGRSVHIANTLEPRFEHSDLKALVRDKTLRERLKVVDLKDDERALVWVDGRLDAILDGGIHAYWSTSSEIVVERFSVNEPRFVHEKLSTVLEFSGASRYLDGVRVESYERVMVFRDGELLETLGAGRYVYWRGGPCISWKAIDLREQVVDIQGQEIMTSDKVTLRVNLVAAYRVTDPVKAVTDVTDWSQALYREAQLELRSAIGGRTLERLLADKDEVGNEIRNGLAKRVGEFGVGLSSVGLRDIILPGDMKVILNEVILAQKQAEANLIKRREETAAARSQANTAKLLADNPVLARMKELEALQEILKGSSTTFVLGSGDLSEQIGSLIRREAASSSK